MMSFNKFVLFREFFAKQTFLKSIKLKNISTETKSDKKIKEIKDFVINQKQLDSNPLKDVKKAVVLYGNENSNFFRKLFFFNCFQFSFWLYMSHSGIALILKKPKSEADRQKLESDKSVLNKLNYLWTHNRNHLFLSIAILICGQLSMTILTLYTIRSVRYLILSPGGHKVRITTFSISGSPNRYRNYDVPIEKVSALTYRTTGVNYIPLKVKGKWFYYLIDSKGQFYKPSLYDQTVGVFRPFK